MAIPFAPCCSHAADRPTPRTIAEFRRTRSLHRAAAKAARARSCARLRRHKSASTTACSLISWRRRSRSCSCRSYSQRACVLRFSLPKGEGRVRVCCTDDPSDLLTSFLSSFAKRRGGGNPHTGRSLRPASDAVALWATCTLRTRLRAASAQQVAKWLQTSGELLEKLKKRLQDIYNRSMADED